MGATRVMRGVARADAERGHRDGRRVGRSHDHGDRGHRTRRSGSADEQTMMKGRGGKPGGWAQLTAMVVEAVVVCGSVSGNSQGCADFLSRPDIPGKMEGPGAEVSRRPEGPGGAGGSGGRKNR